MGVYLLMGVYLHCTSSSGACLLSCSCVRSLRWIQCGSQQPFMLRSPCFTDGPLLTTSFFIKRIKRRSVLADTALLLTLTADRRWGLLVLRLI